MIFGKCGMPMNINRWSMAACAMKPAITHYLPAIGKTQGQPERAGLMHLEPEQLAMTQRRQEALRLLANEGIAHRFSPTTTAQGARMIAPQQATVH